MAITCATALGALLPVSARAQQRHDPVHFGIQANFGGTSKLGIGARVRYRLSALFPTTPLSSIASVDLYFPNSATWLDINYNVVYDFHPASAPKIMPYAGAGVNFVSAIGGGSGSQLGLNLIGGTEFVSHSTVTPFAELRLTISGIDQLVVTGGIRF